MTFREIRQICDGAIPKVGANGRLQGSFRMGPVVDGLLRMADAEETFPTLDQLRLLVSERTFNDLVQGILRASFFVEPVVLPDCTTTRFNTRWQLADLSDPRSATTETCVAMMNHLLGLVCSWIETDGAELLELMFKFNLVAYEMPIEYLSRDVPVHRLENVGLIDPKITRRVVKLRAALLNREDELSDVFQPVYKKKVAIKAYLTDRVLTGNHKTNREKRWEANPASVHFASRQACMEIEHSLISEICHFEGFPAHVLDELVDEGLIERGDRPRRCPVTLQPLNFDEFAEEVLNPDHGRSSFQVGHMDPLKLDGNEWSNGHRSENIAWISADGNRIQGSLSVEQTRELLKNIWTQYRAGGLL